MWLFSIIRVRLTWWQTHACSQKMVIMGSLSCLSASKWPLDKEIQTLESMFMQLGISYKGSAFASIEFRVTFIEEIKDKHLKDDSLNELKKKIVSVMAQDATLYARVCSVWKKGFLFLEWMAWFRNCWQNLTVLDILFIRVWKRCIEIWRDFISDLEWRKTQLNLWLSTKNVSK